jgi:hypothetical protein
LLLAETKPIMLLSKPLQVLCPVSTVFWMNSSS